MRSFFLSFSFFSFLFAPLFPSPPALLSLMPVSSPSSWCCFFPCNSGYLGVVFSVQQASVPLQHVCSCSFCSLSFPSSCITLFRTPYLLFALLCFLFCFLFCFLLCSSFLWSGLFCCVFVLSYPLAFYLLYLDELRLFWFWFTLFHGRATIALGPLQRVAVSALFVCFC